MDEKDFLINLYNTMKCIIIINEFKIKFFWVGICINETTLLLILIYENNFGNLQNF